MNIAGRGNLFIDDKLIIELSVNPKQGDSFFGLGTVDVRTVLKGLKAETKHKVEVRLSNKEFIARGAPFATRGGIRLGTIRQIDPEEGIKQAVDLAKASDSEYTGCSSTPLGAYDPNLARISCYTGHRPEQ